MSRITGLTPIVVQKGISFDVSRLSVSDGICNKGSSRIGSRTYREIAYLPQDNWRPLTAAEGGLLLPKQPQIEWRQFIGIFKISDGLLQAAWDEGIAAARTE